MARTSDGRIFRAVRGAHSLISVAAKILGVDAAMIEKRAETSSRLAEEIAKGPAAVADRAKLKFIEAALRGEPWAVRVLLMERRSHRNPDAKSWDAGVNELGEQESAELEQQLGINYQAPNLPQTYPKFTPNLPQIYPKFTPNLPQIYPKFTPL